MLFWRDGNRGNLDQDRAIRPHSQLVRSRALSGLFSNIEIRHYAAVIWLEPGTGQFNRFEQTGQEGSTISEIAGPESTVLWPRRFSLKRRMVSGSIRRPLPSSNESASVGHWTTHAPHLMQRSP